MSADPLAQLGRDLFGDDRADDLAQAHAAGVHEGTALGLARSGLPASVRVPLPIRARAVRAGEVIEGDDGELFAVVASRSSARGWTLHLVCGDWRDAVEVDPDEPVPVLVPLVLADAAALVCGALDEGGLGARITSSRLNPDGSDGEPVAWIMEGRR